MGPILDVAVFAMTLVVVASLLLLAWTIAFGLTAAIDGAHRRVATLRDAVADLQAHARSDRSLAE